MERVVGIEPTSSAWKAEVLPLNYTRAMHRTRRPRACFVLASHPTLASPYGGGGRIRTFEGVSRQIYSLLPLAAWVPLRENEPRILISRGQQCQCILARKLLARTPSRPTRYLSKEVESGLAGSRRRRGTPQDVARPAERLGAPSPATERYGVVPSCPRPSAEHGTLVGCRRGRFFRLAVTQSRMNGPFQLGRRTA